MLLQELTLHDFRTYGGRQTIPLAPKKDKPIILIGGLNGAGKTTLLDALQLVLYGQRAQCASRGTLGYKTYLRQTIHRHADPSSGASIALKFTHASEGEQREYCVRRTWYATPAGLRERVEVDVDGELDPVLTEQWDERVDDFAPHRISQLFFFDGEKIAELAEQESSVEVLKTAVHSLLGLDLVDRLTKDLGILDSKKRREGDTSFDRTKVEHLEAECERLSGESKRVAEERATLHTSLDRAEQNLSQVEQRYRGEGGELAEQRSALEAEQKALQSSLLDRRERMRELTLGSLPLAMVGELLTEIDDQAHVEAEAHHHSLISGILEHRDEHVLKRMKSGGAVSPVLAQLEQVLAEDRRDREVHHDDPGFLNLDPDDIRQLDRLVKAEVPSQLEQARGLNKELDSLDEKSLILDRKLKSIPEEGNLANLRDERGRALLEVESLRVRWKAQDDRYQVLKSQLEQARESFKRELEKELVAVQSNEGLHRKLDRISVASKALEDFRAQVLTSNLGRVEAAVLDSFQELIRKPNLVSGLEIDAETFSLKLIGGGSRTLEREDLSAGEKQLLAIAMLWGLARTSGLPLPVIIDTPLGRLDSKHRSHLVDRYFPNASHQVLLLSTDEEIKEHRLNELEPHVGRSYLLEYDEEEDRTVIQEGYFKN
jgi:DNA sulfur modification protein DndD